MATSTGPAKRTRDQMCDSIRLGSSYSALTLATDMKVQCFQELVQAVRLPLPGKRRTRAFNALADGYDVYADGLERHLLPPA